MSDNEANEQARRNYAIEAYTFGEDYYLQLYCGGEVLATVSAGVGPVEPEEFIVYNGTGLDENDLEDESMIAKRFEVDINPMDAWREAARYCYIHALSKMMIPDQRLDREVFGADF